MAYPSEIDSFTPPSGTSLLTSPDHADLHARMGSAIPLIEAKLGVGSGSPTLNRVLVGSGNGTSQWSTTANGLTLGTPAITGGTISSSVINNPTIGTPAVTGGTVTALLVGTLNASLGTLNNGVLGTPAITGGTVNNAVLGTPTLTLGSDAAGDLFTRSAGGTINRIPGTTVGYVLSSNGVGTVPSYRGFGATMDYVSAYLSADTSALGNGTPTKVNFDTEVFDTNSNYTGGTYTVATGNAGKRRVKAQMYFYTGLVDQTTYRAMIYRNGTLLVDNRGIASGANAPVIVGVQRLIALAAGDTIEFYGQSDSGNGSVKVFGNLAESWCEIEQISQD